MVFTTYDGGVAKQVMDLSATNANTVTIGTGSNDANLKVYGTLTAASTAYENDILPAVLDEVFWAFEAAQTEGAWKGLVGQCLSGGTSKACAQAHWRR